MKKGCTTKYVLSFLLVTVVILAIILPDDVEDREGFKAFDDIKKSFQVFAKFNKMRRNLRNTIKSTKDKIMGFFHGIISRIKGIMHKFTHFS